ncbi:hypothetical protein FACS189475_08820 [Betaproteobacteria bacterium]|nr:hypothetical protein FACS189475_08820 [Betaproteobacteria bacterium]
MFLLKKLHQQGNCMNAIEMKDQIELIIDENGLRLDYSGMETALNTLYGEARNDSTWRLVA